MVVPRRTISGETLADAHMPELQVVIEGLLAPRRFLDLLRDFIVFENEGRGRLIKKMAGYHQFHAVQVAVGETLRAAELARAGITGPAFFLLRPDGHVALAGTRIETGAVERYFAQQRIGAQSALRSRGIAAAALAA